MLRTGTMTIRFVDTEIGPTLMKVKLGELPPSAALELGLKLEEQYPQALRDSTMPEKRPISLPLTISTCE